MGLVRVSFQFTCRRANARLIRASGGILAFEQARLAKKPIDGGKDERNFLLKAGCSFKTDMRVFLGCMSPEGRRRGKSD
jgi:hypothetical protein